VSLPACNIKIAREEVLSFWEAAAGAFDILPGHLEIIRDSGSRAVRNSKVTRKIGLQSTNFSANAFLI
jgi:hypothetical protein